jgi:colicin import membrane protein
MRVGMGVVLVLAPACGPRTFQARMEAAERRGDRASALMDEAQRALDAVEPDRAQDRLRDAREQVSSREMEANPEAGLLRSRLAELEARLPEVKARRARNELAKKVAERKQVIEASLSRLRAAVAELKPGVVDRSLPRVARNALRSVRDDIAWRKELQTEDPDFGGYVEALGVELDSTERKIDVAEKVAAFAEGPVRALESASAQMDKAKAEARLSARLDLENDALGKYRACADEAKKQLTDDPGLERAQVLASGRLTSPPEVQKTCESRATAQQKLVAATRKALDRELKLQAKAEAKAKKAAEAKARKKRKAATGSGL